MKRLDLTNQKFGRLTALSPIKGIGGQRKRSWLCRCDCGNESIVDTYRLSRGVTVSCGCYRNEVGRAIHLRHGHTSVNWHSPTYIAWAGIVERCTNHKKRQYKDYGGRGITVCERWRDFANFLADMGERPSDTHSIDRINNDGNYEPGNCRWATDFEQAANKRNNRLLTFKGQTKPLTAWARDIGLRHATLRERLEKMSVEEALSRPRMR